MISTPKREIHVPSHFCTLGCSLLTVFSFITFVYIPYLTICVSVSQSLVYGIKEKLKLRVKTALVNTISHRDLLSIDSLVNSRLISATSQEMSNILNQMKKHSRTDCALSNSSVPLKKQGTTKDASPIRTLPPPFPSEIKGNSRKVLISSLDRFCSFRT